MPGMLMRRVLEEEILGLESKVDILLSKWDLVLSRQGGDKSEKLLQGLREEFERRFMKRVGRLRVLSIAARPDPGSALPPAYGMEDLFRSWVEEPPARVQRRFRRSVVPVANLPFDTFAVRQAPDLFEEGK